MTLILLLLLGGDAPGSEIDAAMPLRKPAAGRCSDAAFVRRIHLDLAGSIPTADEVRSFLRKPDRVRLVDRLLASPTFARRMEEALTVMLLERRTGKDADLSAWKRWLRKALAEDVPWNEVVARILSTHGRDEDGRPPLAFFLAGRTDPHVMTRDVGRIFLGRDYQCAQCHNHPDIRDWRQTEYMGLYAYLATSKPWTDKKTKTTYLMETRPSGPLEFESVFKPGILKETLPVLEGRDLVQIPEQVEWKVAPERKDHPGIPEFSLKERLARDLASPDNDRFVRNAVNRLWFLFMGRGLVHPLDWTHSKNPPSHPELMDLLAKRFVEDGLRIRPFVRRIVLSDAYQRSGLLPEGVDPATVRPEEYRAALVRPLSAEQIGRSLLRATGVELPASGPDSGFKVKDYLNGRTDPPDTRGETETFFAAIFGAPPGQAEVDFSPSTTHALFLMNERLVRKWIDTGGLLRRLEGRDDPGAVAEELYLSVLSRRPDADERRTVAEHLERKGAPRELIWALVASAEFRFNH